MYLFKRISSDFTFGLAAGVAAVVFDPVDLAAVAVAFLGFCERLSIAGFGLLKPVDLPFVVLLEVDFLLLPSFLSILENFCKDTQLEIGIGSCFTFQVYISKTSLPCTKTDGFIKTILKTPATIINLIMLCKSK